MTRTFKLIFEEEHDSQLYRHLFRKMQKKTQKTKPCTVKKESWRQCEYYTYVFIHILVNITLILVLRRHRPMSPTGMYGYYNVSDRFGQFRRQFEHGKL